MNNGLQIEKSLSKYVPGPILAIMSSISPNEGEDYSSIIQSHTSTIRKVTIVFMKLEGGSNSFAEESLQCFQEVMEGLQVLLDNQSTLYPFFSLSHLKE